MKDKKGVIYYDYIYYSIDYGLGAYCRASTIYNSNWWSIYNGIRRCFNLCRIDLFNRNGSQQNQRKKGRFLTEPFLFALHTYPYMNDKKESFNMQKSTIFMIVWGTILTIGCFVELLP